MKGGGEIAVDTNLLVYAHREDSTWYGVAYTIIRELAEGPNAWAIPWPCIHEFLSIVTHPRIYGPPTSWKRQSIRWKPGLNPEPEFYSQNRQSIGLSSETLF